MSCLLFLLLSMLPFETHSDITLYQIPEGDEITMLVDLRLQPSLLVFHKRAEKFVSEFEVAVEIRNGEKEQLVSDFWQYFQSFGTYSETKQIYPVIARVISLDVPKSQEYRLTVKVNDLVADNVIIERSMEAKGYMSVAGFSVSDLIPIDTENQTRGKRIIGTTNREGGLLSAYYEIHGGPGVLERTYWVESFDHTVLLSGEVESLDVEGTFRDTLIVNVDSLPGGTQVLRVEFRSGDQIVAEREVRIAVSGFRVLTDKQFNEMVDMLMYIATDAEMKDLRNVTVSKRAEAWDEFWRARDPDPETPQNQMEEIYMLRVREATELFSIGRKPGWKTDRGMVWIKFGPPGEIERHPFDYETRPYEVWYYYIMDLTIIFMDRTGVGDYEFYEYDPRIYTEPFTF
jgi:GWxTD domain-containing protein